MKVLQLLWSPSRPEAERKGGEIGSAMEGDHLQIERMEAWDKLENSFWGSKMRKSKQEDQKGWRIKGMIVSLVFKTSELNTKTVKWSFVYSSARPSIQHWPDIVMLGKLNSSAPLSCFSVFYKLQPIFSCWDRFLPLWLKKMDYLIFQTAIFSQVTYTFSICIYNLNLFVMLYTQNIMGILKPW